EIVVRAAEEVLADARRGGVERLRRARRDREDLPGPRRRAGRRGRRLLDHGVRVGAAEPERADARAAGRAARLPAPEGRADEERAGIEIDLRIGGIVMEAGRDLRALHGE